MTAQRMQITRQRVRPEMNIETIEKCPTCKGTGEISPTILFADDLENHIRNICQEYDPSKITIQVHPIVAAYLKKGPFSIRQKWSVKYRRPIKIVQLTSLNLLEYHILDKFGDEIIL